MEEINIKTLLPVGEKLKPLLSKSCIGESDLKGILAERGVFIGNSSKQMSIPFFTLSIISPKEFEKLQEFQKTKEDSVKFRTSKIKSSINDNLNEILPLSLLEPQDINNESSNYTINTDMQFTINSENNLILEYEILREDITKDWANCESKYTGRIEIAKDEETKEIKFRNEFTSSETGEINKKVIRTVVNFFKNKGIVKNSDNATELSATEFNNNQRFTFMLSIANDSPNGYLKFKAVKNIEIGPDRESKHQLPDSAKWMDGSVKNIIINSEKGETLENVEYISEESYHEVLILRQIQAEYEFEFAGMKGKCIIEYGFPHYFRKNIKGNAFESRLANIYFSKTSKSQNIKNATRLILKEFEKLYQSKYVISLEK